MNKKVKDLEGLKGSLVLERVKISVVWRMNEEEETKRWSLRSWIDLRGGGE